MMTVILLLYIKNKSLWEILISGFDIVRIWTVTDSLDETR